MPSSKDQTIAIAALDHARRTLKEAQASVEVAEAQAVTRLCPFKRGDHVPLNTKHVLLVYGIRLTTPEERAQLGVWVIHGLVCVDGGANPAFTHGHPREEELSERQWNAKPKAIRDLKIHRKPRPVLPKAPVKVAAKRGPLAVRKAKSS